MFKNFFKNEEGQGMVEYGLILALIAIVVIAAVGRIGEATNTKFNKVAEELEKEPSTGGETD